MTAEGVLAFLLWFAGASAMVIGVVRGDWRDVAIGLICVIAGDITGRERKEDDAEERDR